MQLRRHSKAHFIMRRASRQMKPLQRLRLISQLRIHFIPSLASREALPPPPKLLIKDEFRCPEKIDARVRLFAYEKKRKSRKTNLEIKDIMDVLFSQDTMSYPISTLLR